MFLIFPSCDGAAQTKATRVYHLMLDTVFYVTKIITWKKKKKLFKYDVGFLIINKPKIHWDSYSI